jgi:NADPH2:quinone reductase
MTAVGNPDVLQVRDVPVPDLPDESHCLVRVRAAGVNPLDCRVRRLNPYYPDRLPALLGCDGAGTVERAGSACKRFKPGDEVYFFTAGLGGAESGCYAQYTVVHEDYLAPKPANLGMIEAAALPLVLITAWESLVYRGNIEPGQCVLVHAGAGGVGHVAIQLARCLRARVAATVKGQEKAAFVRALGAELAIDYSRQDFVAEVRRWTEGDGADIVLDTVGGETFLRSFEAARLYGRVITLLATAIDTAHANKARGRNLLLGYEGMVAPTLTDNQRARRAQTRILDQGVRLVERGKLRPVVSEVLPLERAADAHALLEQGHMQGKIVLEIE